MRTRSPVVILIALAAVYSAAAAPPNKEALEQQYDAFVQSLDHRSLAKDYPGAVRNLDSPEPKRQAIGIKTLAATEEVKAIPWIVPFLDSEDRNVRIQAGVSLNALVATHQLKRRDKSQPDRVVILPPGPGDIDLKPVSWVIFKMLCMPDDGNTHAFAANMIGYGGFDEYADELRELLKSKHPAVTAAARRAIEMIDARRPDGKDAENGPNVYKTAWGKVEIALVPDKREIMVGEPVRLSFVVRNLSDSDLQTIQGGDYRNRLGRPESYAVTAIDPSGRAVPMLNAGPTLGGIEGPQQIPAKGTWTRRLFLPRWIKLTKVGTYTIKCTTTLRISKATAGGWDPREGTIDVAVEATTQLTLVPLEDDRMGEFIDALGDKMLDARSDISEEAVRYLTAIEDERVIPFFNEAARSSNYGLRFAAMNALAKFRSDGALRGIKEGLGTQASDMMANSTSEEVAQQLADNIRHSAAVALSNSPHPQARELLLSMWEDPYYGVRIDVLHALGKMDTPESLQMLRKMADDANELVRNEALRYIDLRSTLPKSSDRNED